MNKIGPEQLLSQIRLLGRELQTGGSADAGAANPAANFGALLKTSLSAVNDAQQTSANLKVGFETGSGSATLAEVMIASQKADLSFRAVTEVRNKLVTAYQEIMNMPV
ncbi:MAG: flagellar hook-basal body complex protein FliE [Woeseia sp.]